MMPLPDHRINVVDTTPFEGQRPGTSGLRKKVTEFKQTNYTENFLQCTLDAMGDKLEGSHLVLGGDGRYYNKDVALLALKICAANGVKKVTIGQDALMSTPAVSCFIRKFNLDGGIILTASHNPGGPTGDLGIKFNISNGGPAPFPFTERIYELTKKIKEYNIVRGMQCDFSKLGVNEFSIDGKPFVVEVIDPVVDYLQLMQEIFDFPAIKTLITGGFKILIDCLCGITGIYATKIFVDELGAPSDSVIHGVPKEDFGKMHPDPNLTYAKEMVAIMKDEHYDFGATFDGDGDRNMIIGRKAFYVTPSDSLAVLADHIKCIPYFKKTGVKGFARSMPTAAAVDLVAEKNRKPMFEVPTGWKFFGNLMDADMLSLCGEESFGTGSDHIREKDGIWAALAWLSVLADTKESVKDLVWGHWRKYGRNYFTRWDYEYCDLDRCGLMMAELEKLVLNRDFIGTTLGKDDRCFTVARVENFSYTDPIDKSVTTKQGLRIIFRDGSRLVIRLSGTGSTGSTVRIYIDRYEDDESRMFKDAQDVLSPLMQVALELCEMKKYTGKENPTVIT